MNTQKFSQVLRDSGLFSSEQIEVLTKAMQALADTSVEDQPHTVTMTAEEYQRYIQPVKTETAG